MGNVNIKLSDEVSIVASVPPQSGASGAAKSSGYVDVRTLGGKRFLALIQAGAIGTGGSLAAKIQQATSSGGAGLKDVTGKAITALTKAGTDQSNDQALINFRPTDLDLDNGFYFFKLVITNTQVTSPTAATLLAGLVIAANDEYQPQTQAATVVQTV